MRVDRAGNLPKRLVAQSVLLSLKGENAKHTDSPGGAVGEIIRKTLSPWNAPMKKIGKIFPD
jgi:hypothetical protein